jgi:hypothetical protein
MRAVGLGEDEVLVVPLGPGQHPLTELGGLVPVQFDQGQRQREGAVAALALRLPEDQPPPRTRWTLRRTVRVLASGLRKPRQAEQLCASSHLHQVDEN